MDKKKILIACIALGVLLVGTMVWFFVSENSGKAGAKTESSVTASLPDGEVQRMTDSKSEAFRGRVSTDDYFDQLGARPADDEDISLVSSEGELMIEPRFDSYQGIGSAEYVVVREKNKYGLENRNNRKTK